MLGVLASRGAEPLSTASPRADSTTPDGAPNESDQSTGTRRPVTSPTYEGLTTHATPNKKSTVFSDKLMLKLLHRVEAGVHPDLEMGRFLSENRAFPHTPQVVGAVDYRADHEETITVGILPEYIPHATTAWQFAQDALARFFEHVMAQPPEGRPPAAPAPGQSYVELAEGDAPQLAKDLLGGLLEWSALLGRQTGELHLRWHPTPATRPSPLSRLLNCLSGRSINRHGSWLCRHFTNCGPRRTHCRWMSKLRPNKFWNARNKSSKNFEA